MLIWFRLIFTVYHIKELGQYLDKIGFWPFRNGQKHLLPISKYKNKFIHCYMLLSFGVAVIAYV